MRAEDAARVLAGGSANASDSVNAQEGLVDQVDVVVGSRGAEPRTASNYGEEIYAEGKREAVATSAEERGDDTLGTLVRGGLRLKPQFDKDRQPSREKTDDEAIRDTAVELAITRREQLRHARTEVDDHRIAAAVEDTLAMAETLDDWDESSEVQRNALAHLEEIEDDQVRLAAYQRVEHLADPDVYETHVDHLQRQYAASEYENAEARAAATVAEIERDAETQAAVLQVEEQRIEALPPLAQHLCRSMISEQGDAIAEMPTREMYVALAYARNAAKLMAAEIEAGETEAEIVRAWPGKLRPGAGDVSRRDRREYSAHELGVAREAWRPEMGNVAKARAEAEVERDIETAARVRHHGQTGAEAIAEARREVARLTGVPLR